MGERGSVRTRRSSIPVQGTPRNKVNASISLSDSSGCQSPWLFPACVTSGKLVHPSSLCLPLKWGQEEKLPQTVAVRMNREISLCCYHCVFSDTRGRVFSSSEISGSWFRWGSGDSRESGAPRISSPVGLGGLAEVGSPGWKWHPPQSRMSTMTLDVLDGKQCLVSQKC